MSGLFIAFYRFFKHHTILLSFLLIVVLGTSIFFATRIRLEEDVTKMVPMDEDVKKFNYAFRNFKFMDKLVLTLSLKDTSQRADILAAYAGLLEDTLQKSLVPEYISKINGKTTDRQMLQLYETMYGNLPYFLTEKDYQILDTLVREENVKESVRSAYQTLISPASMVMKKFITRDPLGLTPLALKKLENLQVSENFVIYNGYVATSDLNHLLIFLTPAHPSGETAENKEMINKLDKILSAIPAEYRNQINVSYFGSAAVAVGNANRIKKDIMLTVSIALIVVMLFISLFFKRSTIFFILFIPAVVGAVISLMVLYFVKSKISAISIGAGAVLLGITVDYSLHLFTHFRSTGSVSKTLRDTVLPVLMSSLTTATAFLCLFFVSSEALHDLGLFTAISVLGAALFALLVLPVFFKNNKQNKRSKKTGKSFLDRFTAYPFDKNKVLIYSIAVLSIVLFFTARHVSFDPDMAKMNYMSPKMHQAENHLDNISDITMKSIYLISTGQNISQALQNSEKIAQKLDSLEKVKLIEHYASANSLLISDSLQKIRFQRWEQFWTHKRKQTVKNILIEEGRKYKFKETAFMPFFQLLDKDFKPLDRKELGIINEMFLDDWVTTTKDMSMVATLLKIKEKNKQEIHQAFAEDNNTIIIDRQYLTNKFMEILQQDFNHLVSISLVIVLAILVLIFGRIELGLITFFPMILSWIWTLGIMGIFHIEFTIFNIIISTFIVGLGIDYSIFIMRGLLQEYKTGVKNLTSFKTSILLSAFTTLSGIGVMIFARHPSLKSIALLSIIGITSVVLISYTIQPLLFRWLVYSQKTGKKRALPLTMSNILYSGIAFTLFFGASFLMSLIGIGMIRLLPVKKKKRTIMLRKFMQFYARILFKIAFIIKREYRNPYAEDFSKPAIIIANHQSVIDIMLLLSLSPKITLLTNDNAQKNPFYGRLARFAGFPPASAGVEATLEVVKKQLDQGNSVAIFPEATRSPDNKIRRFHKGAFYLAEQTGADIIPLLIHGAVDCMPKNEFIVRKGKVSLKILKRIPVSDSRFGNGYRQRTKKISRFFKAAYKQLQHEVETPRYFKKKLIYNYLYKGPVLEWYLRVKLHMEENYQIFNQALPRQGLIYDLGCGYGFISYMLSFVSSERQIIGIDYDEDKIQLAKHCISNHANLEFITNDITSIVPQKAHGFILGDVLHYLTYQQQNDLLEKCIAHLQPGGTILIREGNSQSEKRHKKTRMSEWFSTKTGFNKTSSKDKKLFFTSKDALIEVLIRNKLIIEIIDKKDNLSNIFIIARKIVTK